MDRERQHDSKATWSNPGHETNLACVSQTTQSPLGPEDDPATPPKISGPENHLIIPENLRELRKTFLGIHFVAVKFHLRRN